MHVSRGGMLEICRVAVQLLPINSRRLSPSPLSGKRSPACDQVTGRGLAVRSREAGRASFTTAVLLRSLSVSASFLRFSIRLDTEIRRCTHWVLTSKECRNQRERDGLFRAGLSGFRRGIMDKTLHILQKSVDGVSTRISLDMSLNMDDGEDFTEQQIVGLPDKIPLVKPYFKKKQRKLDAKCLHRALEDPILTTLLSTDALVSGDGVFVPRNQPGRTPGNLCAAAVVKQNCRGQVCLKNPGAAADPTAGTGVPGLMTRDGDVEIADTTAELEETERRGERPKITDPTPDSRCFQPKPGLRAAGSTVTITPPGRDIPPTVAPQALHQGESIKSNGLLTSEAQNLPVKACTGVQDPLLLQPDNGVLFQDKSEEASLDLVFELLTQLQYHTHQSDSVDICVDFLQGQCVYGNDCAHHHTVLPYHWQIHRTNNQTWQSIADDSQEQLERLYCNPDNEQVRLKFQGRVFSLDFGAMRVCDLEYDRVRRLTTPASPLPTPTTNSNPTPSCQTVWKYYCRDNFGWREYSEPVVKLIEEASLRGLKEVRFITLQNQYILNIREGFQQNAIFGFRRQIKKRPMFMSSVMLTPHLQTLSGLSSSPLPCSASSSSSMDLSVSHPLSPTTINPASLFPETWLPMTMSQDFLQVPVSREDRSYRTVYSLFHKTVSETKFRILKIQRVQNPFLWEKYKRKKEYMSRRMSEMDRLLSERHLFHGTSADVVEGICKHNFDPRVCGKHATMFGQGSYFARKAVYSHNFSKRSPKGVHCMFLAKVLTGRFTVGNPSMRRPPPINLRDPSSDLYDSCVDNWVDPQIYVIFNDDQSYPYFIIHYEEVPSTVAV
ncbi:hypothetical protein FQN60_004748 [Etheostoma spectabile]|uniref:Poly [ADP-ribose] polymerase n=2 Tax=Etheostoma spectabile TaxID=54343 RepID=A0A5J5DKK1_9PERO|nr:hypothetical protein FQN60_004748 [Etheostoma spectabile]